MKVSLYFGALIAASFTLASCGGGSSPSEPAPVAQVGGTWIGVWNIAGISFPLTPELVLVQNGSSTTGTIDLLNVVGQVAGTVNTTASTYQWQVVNGGCGSFNGSASFAGLAPVTMNGTATLDSLGCGTGAAFYTGTVTWTKGAAATAKKHGSVNGTLTNLVDALRGADHRLQ